MLWRECPIGALIQATFEHAVPIIKVGKNLSYNVAARKSSSKSGTCSLEYKILISDVGLPIKHAMKDVGK